MKKLKVFSLKVFFLIILYTIFFVVLAQSNNFIYIYTRSKTVNTPLNNTSNLIISNKVIHSSGLLNFFNKHKITTFQRAFANFNLKDTIKYDALGHSIKMLNLANYYRIAISDTSFADSLINELEKIPGVVYAEKSLKIRLNTNDPNYNIQWYLKNIGQGGGTVGADINIENAWQIFTGSSSIKIGLIDTGVKTDHEDLSGKVTGDQPDYNYSDYSHGTSVAGIAGAITNNNLGIAGVDQKAQLYSKRIFDSNGDNNNPAYVYNAIVNAVDNGCNILNNSWDGDYAPTERCAFAYAYKQNVLSIASMNDHGETTPTYPAAYGQGILSVGATDENDLHASYSESGSWIDVSAPGTDIFSTVAYYQPYYEEYYDYMSGTSFSAPVVSGIASLLKGYRPNLYNDDIQNIIELSADKVHPDIYSYDANGWNNQIGYGRVDAYRALEFLNPPYTLDQLTTSGGTDYYKGPLTTTPIYGVNGLADGPYLTYRHEVRKSVNFTSMQNPHIWGRGVASAGWSSESPNYGMEFCGVVSGSVTNTSATLFTYVYEVYTLNGDWVGWYPTTPTNTVFSYSVLGIPTSLSVSISGPVSLGIDQNGTWNASVIGGYSPYSYKWYYEYPGGGGGASPSTLTNNNISPDLPPSGTWYSIGSNSPTLTAAFYETIYLKCVATDSKNNSITSNIMTVNIGTSKITNQNGVGAISRSIASEDLPKLYSMKQNFPNPFNPTTVIHYEIPNDGLVTLKVFDELGREVKTLVNQYQSKGRYDINFNSTNLSSGIYLYQLRAGNFISTKKMLLLK